MAIHFPRQVLGYHGCDRDFGEKVLAGTATLTASRRSHDWLGHGIYFWENSPLRAIHWAKTWRERASTHIKEPFAFGAIIDLGNCLNLLNHEHLELLRSAYESLKASNEVNDIPMPLNKTIGPGNELLLRHLDRAVIQWLHKHIEDERETPFDSVRGMFPEGKELYENAGFRDKNHIQLAIVNPKCIIGYFRVAEFDE